MKRTLLLTVGFGLFASVALAQIPPAATSAPSAQDFVNKVAISDMFEIQSSQLALSKEADADTKPFAEKMVQDHQKTSSELKGLAEGSMVKLTLPTSLDSEHQNMLNELKPRAARTSTRPTIKFRSRPTVKRSRFSRLFQKAVRIPS
jgi:putative membrane protein